MHIPNDFNIVAFYASKQAAELNGGKDVVRVNSICFFASARLLSFHSQAQAQSSKVNIITNQKSIPKR